MTPKVEMRLIDLHPEWINWEGRHGIGIKFDCMTGHCAGKIWVLFANPLDGGAPYPGDAHKLFFQFWDVRNKSYEGGIPDRCCGKERWQRTGDVFETLSMTPSVNAWECGHLTLTHGEWR